MNLEERLEAFRRKKEDDPGLPAAPRPTLLVWEGRLKSPAPLRRCRLYLDIETTGFHDGLPVVLVGWAWAEAGDALVYWQGSPGDLHNEGDLLAEALTARDGIVVTYNGTSFDLPRLSSRALAWGVAMPGWEHDDLLPTARRLYGHRRPSLGLSSLEQALLGIRRPPDLPGDAIAENVRLYLETGERAFMDEVASHNRHDLLALAVLDSRIATDLATRDVSGDLAFGQGRVHLATGRPNEALAAFGAVPEDSPLAQRAAAMAARAARAAGKETVRHLLRATAPLPSPRAQLDLARALERERQDLAGAVAACEEGIAALAMLGEAGQSSPLMALLQRRRRRLSRLLARRTG